MSGGGFLPPLWRLPDACVGFRSGTGAGWSGFPSAPSAGGVNQILIAHALFPRTQQVVVARLVVRDRLSKTCQRGGQNLDTGDVLLQAIERFMQALFDLARRLAAVHCPSPGGM